MTRRLPVVLAVVAALLGLAAADRIAESNGKGDGGSGGAGAASSLEPRALAPVTGPADALSTTWFCAGGTASEDGVADHTVVIANTGQAAVRAQVTAYPGTLSTADDAAEVAAMGTPTTTVDVPARSRSSVRLAELVQAPFAAALVEVDGGSVAVEHVLSGGGDRAAGPCASAAASSWYFATGATTRDARLLLAVFNPFPEPAVVDMSFIVPAGTRRPNQFQGFPVNGGSVVVIDVGAVVTRYNQVSTSVIARSGRVVVDRIQVFDGSEGTRGMDVTLGAPSPAGLWFFPDGLVTDGLTEVFSIYNPGEQQAEVDLEVALHDPATNGAVDPFEISVPPLAYVLVVMNNEARVPRDVPHAVTVRSANGVPVVAERFLSGASPSSRTGVGYSVGSPIVSTRWVLAAGRATDETSEVVVVQNPSSATIATFSVSVLAGGVERSVAALDALEVEPAGRVGIDLGEYVTGDALTVVVESDVAVVVERRLATIGARGLALSPAIAAFERAEVPDPESTR